MVRRPSKQLCPPIGAISSPLADPLTLMTQDTTVKMCSRPRARGSSALVNLVLSEGIIQSPGYQVRQLAATVQLGSAAEVCRGGELQCGRRIPDYRNRLIAQHRSV